MDFYSCTDKLHDFSSICAGFPGFCPTTSVLFKNLASILVLPLTVAAVIGDFH